MDKTSKVLQRLEIEEPMNIVKQIVAITSVATCGDFGDLREDLRDALMCSLCDLAGKADVMLTALMFPNGEENNHA